MGSGSSQNNGNQAIGWKYYTPLKSDYINSFMGSVCTPGLVTRPLINIDVDTNGTTNGSCMCTINPFTCYMVPQDTSTSVIDENDKQKPVRLVKITTQTATNKMAILSDHVAIGLNYALANLDTHMFSQDWYAEFVPLTISDISSFKGIIIATVQCFIDTISAQGQTKYWFSITTSGADISNVLLQQEGWDPSCWISLISPRRFGNTSGGNYYNRIEVRGIGTPATVDDLNNENKNYGESTRKYLTGIIGVESLDAGHCTLPFPVIYPNRDPNRIRGFMSGKYTLISFNTDYDISTGSNLHMMSSDGISNFNNRNIPGGNIALLDNNNIDTYSEDTNEALLNAFTNKIKISPLQQEILNMHYDSVNKTLYIV